MLSRPAVIFSLQSHLRVTVQPEIHFVVQNYYFFFIYASARAFSIKKVQFYDAGIWIYEYFVYSDAALLDLFYVLY